MVHIAAATVATVIGERRCESTSRRRGIVCERMVVAVIMVAVVVVVDIAVTIKERERRGYMKGKGEGEGLCHCFFDGGLDVGCWVEKGDRISFLRMRSRDPCMHQLMEK